MRLNNDVSHPPLLSQTALSSPTLARNATAEGHLPGRREKHKSSWQALCGWYHVLSYTRDELQEAVLFVHSKHTENDCASLSDKQSLVLAPAWLCDISN